jgi:hypothetical protein
MVLRRFDRQAQGRRERRLPFAGGARTQALDGETERTAELELALELERLVLIAGAPQRAAPAQAERSPSSRTLRPAAPNSASATGASIPAATREVPSPSVPRSIRTTARPA